MRTGERYNTDKDKKCRLPCLRCDRMFTSWDRRQNRLCPTCINLFRKAPEHHNDAETHMVHLPNWVKDARAWDRANARGV